jgi:hypothetical protein
LFENSKFILRASGKRWVETARAEGKTEGMKWLANAIERAHAPPDPNDDFYHVKLRLQREGRLNFSQPNSLNSGRQKLSDVDREQEEIRARQRPDLSVMLRQARRRIRLS